MVCCPDVHVRVEGEHGSVEVVGEGGEEDLARFGASCCVAWVTLKDILSAFYIGKCRFRLVEMELEWF